MAILKCKMCGGSLEVNGEASVIECEYCGTQQTVPNIDDEKKTNLFNRANRLRFACEFGKASGIYENIVAEFPEEAEAYWGLCLCKYGIEYVDDPKTAKKIPTCHRTSFESIFEDENFELAQEYADSVAQKIYREEAKDIERIQKSILQIVEKEEPFDIFICYKETGEDGQRTKDSVMAQDMYDALTEKGYKVFFARITLEDKLGQEYEPYIFAALTSAKIMLAVGTSFDYFNAVWVKNEWSRFLDLMKSDNSKVLIPCYCDIDAYDMPTEFKNLQGQDMGKIGFIQDLVRGIEKIISPQPMTQTHTVQQMIVQPIGPNVEALMKRGYMAIEDFEWGKAKEYFEQVLDMNAECAEAYLGLAMGENKSSTKRKLVFTGRNENRNYRRAKQFADEKLLQELVGYEKELKSEIEKKEEEERKQKEEKIKQREASRITCENKRKEIASVQNLVYTYYKRVYALQLDGTVVATGDNSDGQCNVSDWKDIVDISVAYQHTVGLRADGTVVAVGDNSNGRCNVSQWKNIVAISAGTFHTVGLKADGTVVATGGNTWGECNVKEWKDIIAISANNQPRTVGLKADGTVVAVGDSHFRQCNVESWKDVIAVSTQSEYTIGLKKDGTVDTTGDKWLIRAFWKDIVTFSACTTCVAGLKTDGTIETTNRQNMYKADEWKDVVEISVANDHTVGLRADGSVIAVGKNNDGQCDVSKWKDIVAIHAEEQYTIGLKADGTLVATGNNSFGQCNVSGWKLFNNFETYEQELEDFKREEAERKAMEEAERKAMEEEERKRKDAIKKQRTEYRSQGVCQYCGGAFKGLFTKTCTKCGKVKDY